MPLQHGPRPDGLSDLCVILPTLRCLAFTAPVAKVSDQTALSLSLKACHFLRTAATLPTKFAFHRFAKMNRANPRYVQPTVKIQPTGVRHPKVSAPSVQNPEYGPSVAHLKHAVPVCIGETAPNLVQTYHVGHRLLGCNTFLRAEGSVATVNPTALGASRAVCRWFGERSDRTIDNVLA